MDTTWDCVVVGAGAAGLSAALVLGRARRRTLVVDAGEPSNRFAHGIGGLLGQDGRPSADFYADGRAELGTYPAVELRAGTVVDGERSDDGFLLELDDGRREATRRVLLATGMDYRHPELPGIAERWGRSVFHCPFCHGWEARDGALGVLDRGPAGAHRARMLRLWSDDVTLLPGGPAELEPEDAEALRRAGITVDERPLTGLRGDGDTLSAVVFDDGSERACDGLLVPVRLHQRSPLAGRLGAESAEPNPMLADGLVVDASFQTSVPGLYAAGDLSSQMPSVANAIASGSSAAMRIVQAIVAEPHDAG